MAIDFRELHIEFVAQSPEHADILEVSAAHINSLQNQVKCWTTPTEETRFRLFLNDKDSSEPYTLRQSNAVISLPFRDSQNIILGVQYYIGYMLSLILLEYLYHLQRGERFTALREEEYSQINYFLWNGVVGESANRAEDFISNTLREKHLKWLESLHSIRHGTRVLYKELELRVKETEVALRKLRLGPELHLQSRLTEVFMYTEIALRNQVVQHLNIVDTNAFEKLIEMLAPCPVSSGGEILASLTHSKALDPSLVQRALRSFDARAEQGIPNGNIEPNRFSETENGTLKNESSAQPAGEDSTKSGSVFIDGLVAEAAADVVDPIVTISPPLVQPGPFGAKSDEETPIDALGYTDYAIALANVISDKQTGTPLTVAICAPWGRGKTVLMGFIEEQLGKVEKNDPHRKQTTCIRVSAWEISKTSKVWAEFYSSIISQVQNTLSLPSRLRFRLEFWQTTFPLSFWSTYIFTVLGGLFFISWLTAPGDLFSSTLHLILPEWFTDIDNWVKLLGIVVVVPAFGKWVWTNTFGGLPQQILSNLTHSGSKRRPGTEQEVLSNIKSAQDTFRTVSRKRIVVFVDDIDRASESKILQVLEAIKLFLQSKEFVFVLAMDTKVVRRAVGAHYKFAIDDTTSKEDWGRAYLEKIIQIPFHLPHLTDEQRLDLCNSILEGYESSKDDNQMRTITSTVKTEAQEKESKFSLNNTNKQPEDEKSDQITDPEQIAESDRGTDNKDQPADSYRGGLDPWELDIIKTISSEAHLEFSPRLLKRFINIYLVARQLLHSQSQLSEGKVAAPPENFTKWLALSVAFPFESKAFTSWLQTKHWLSLLGDNDGPFSQNGPFSNLGNFHWVVPINGGTKREVPKPNTPFSGLDVERLSKFGKLFLSMGIDSKQLSKTHRISSCFNLVLD